MPPKRKRLPVKCAYCACGSRKCKCECGKSVGFCRWCGEVRYEDAARCSACVVVVSCSLCGKECLGRSMGAMKPGRLPKAYREWVKDGRVIAVEVQGQRRCRACVDRGYRDACALGEWSARIEMREYRVNGEW